MKIALTSQQQAGAYHARKRNRFMTATVDSKVAPAWGTFAFSTNPSNGDTIAVANHGITFVSGAPAPTGNVHIGATLAITLANVVAYLSRPLTELTEATVGLSGDSALLVLSVAPADTTVTLGATGAAITVSHSTLQKQKVRARQSMDNITVTP